MRRVLPLTIVFVAALVLAVEKACPSKVYYTYEVTSPTFKMAWEVRDGSLFDHDGIDVIFKSAPTGSDEWRQVTKSWTDEPTATPHRDCMRFIDSRTGYLFHNEKYAVTTDGGQSWAVWDAERKMQARSCFIQEVKVESDGRGSMTLECSRIHDTYGSYGLSTDDYGRSWHPFNQASPKP